MYTFVEIFILIFFVALFRVSMSKFCSFVEYKKKLLCVIGMVIAYTGILMELVYLAGKLFMEDLTIKEFSIYVCILIFTINIIVAGISIVYCSTGRKRLLSNREKILLKDM